MGRLVRTRDVDGLGLVSLNLPAGAAASRNEPRAANQPGPAPASNANNRSAGMAARIAGGGPIRLTLTASAPQIASIFPAARNYPATDDGLIARFTDFAAFVQAEKAKTAAFMQTYAPALARAVAAMIAYNRNPASVTVPAIWELRNRLFELKQTVAPMNVTREFVSAIQPIIGALSDAATNLNPNQPVPRRIVDDIVDISSVNAGIRQLNELVVANQAAPIANAIRQFCSTLPG